MKNTNSSRKKAAGDFPDFTQADKLDLLRRIALGQELVEKNVCTDGVWALKAVAPDITDRLRALDMHNRLSGEYATGKNKELPKIDGYTIHINGKGWNERA
jgi:hypothetical protein